MKLAIILICHLGATVALPLYQGNYAMPISNSMEFLRYTGLGYTGAGYGQTLALPYVQQPFSRFYQQTPDFVLTPQLPLSPQVVGSQFPQPAAFPPQFPGTPQILMPAPGSMQPTVFLPGQGQFPPNVYIQHAGGQTPQMNQFPQIKPTVVVPSQPDQNSPQATNQPAGQEPQAPQLPKQVLTNNPTMALPSQTEQGYPFYFQYRFPQQQTQEIKLNNPQQPAPTLPSPKVVLPGPLQQKTPLHQEAQSETKLDIPGVGAQAAQAAQA
ncbi:calcium-binding protein P-like isoform X1 [Erpetoichthys calabaricus]|uniref:calcium-binding protein P-like isoform X1 n=1 Tax=Erpetoichthys calabaricus TaxID=27687 RepID=UPI002234C655|nr:calcium-binding protein P-like isoform X1 [Erpetoichthys calabaricus]